MTILFHAHSGLRYLLLLATFAALVMFAQGLARNLAWGRKEQIMNSVVLGLMHLQMLLGVGLLMVGYSSPSAHVHATLMFLGATAFQVLTIVHKKKGRQGFALPLMGLIVALGLWSSGMLIGLERGLFSTTSGARSSS
jgi:hypothetical protein